MSNSSSSFGSLISTIIDSLRNALGGSKQSVSNPPTQPAVPKDNTTEPVRIVTPHVLLIIYDPIIDPATGLNLSQTMKWNRPDDLVNGFIQDILETSGGMARYQIIQRIELNEFPAKTDGFRYDPTSYLAMLNGGQSHTPEMADYQSILAGLSVLPRVENREIDEVWLFAFPHAGLYESTIGGAGAFWCNAPPLTGTSGCDRKFLVMGFSYERGVGEMLESFGHRAESILSKAFDRTQGDANLYARFSLYDKIAPGKAEVGNVHFAPNSTKEYDWNNSRKVPSNCYDWYNFPKFQNDVREVGPDEWGNGDIHAHHKWWLKHLPKVAGRTSGVANNWWQYIMDPNLVYL